jgi:hypothetical protein
MPNSLSGGIAVSATAAAAVGLFRTKASITLARPSETMAKLDPLVRKAGIEMMTPMAAAPTAPSTIANDIGRLVLATIKDVPNAPRPASESCTSDSCPVNPVTKVTDKVIRPKSKVIVIDVIQFSETTGIRANMPMTHKTANHPM